MKEVNIKNVLVTLAFGLTLWFIPAPQGVKPEAWHLFAIFMSTIVGIILKVAPMGTICMIAIGLVACSQVLAPGEAGKSITLAQRGFRGQGHLAHRNFLLHCQRFY